MRGSRPNSPTVVLAVLEPVAVLAAARALVAERAPERGLEPAEANAPRRIRRVGS